MAPTSKALRLLLATGLLNMAVVLGALAAPTTAVACSCAGPPALDGTEEAVLVGRVGPEAGRGRFNFAVERWFKGGAAPAVLLQSALTEFADGQTVIDTCGLNLVPGSHLILAATRGDGALVPAACSPNATVESAEGQALLATAERLYGQGVVPGDPPPTDGDAGSGIDMGLVASVALLAALAVIVIVVLAAVGRRAPSRPDAR